MLCAHRLARARSIANRQDTGRRLDPCVMLSQATSCRDDIAAARRVGGGRETHTVCVIPTCADDGTLPVLLHKSQFSGRARTVVGMTHATLAAPAGARGLPSGRGDSNLRLSVTARLLAVPVVWNIGDPGYLRLASPQPVFRPSRCAPVGTPYCKLAALEARTHRPFANPCWRGCARRANGEALRGRSPGIAGPHRAASAAPYSLRVLSI